jgi:hypothetical protein
MRSPCADESSAPGLPGGERGLMLTELVIVGLLATMVMLALTLFYINSQNVWIEGSTQALAQRDGSLLVDVMRRSVHEANQATVSTTDPNHDQLTLTYSGGRPTIDFRWDSTDSLIHRWDSGTNDNGPVATTPVSRFRVTTLDSTMVVLTQLQLKTANGDSVNLASSFALLGR